MPLHQGYNIVTERIADTDSEVAALEFFRRAKHDETLETPVTVTGLEDLLYNTDETDRSSVLSKLRQTLRGTRSLTSGDAVQFLIDGQLVDDVEFRVRIERSGEGVYLDVGQLFVEEPMTIGATHAVARK
ncbi:hypothetical protein [Haloarcula onubensis]|uniref:DUF8076 domain-containing protein n=1 Tax=Haloarcula onubensis TaxID=2950539 RepID=A0ABU2FUS5_9EURY|nr:hypothetical protein [Halomicroarcula sp. S3CR25-11]MDS0284042.1 hypothetical protein [Halomicroarcula sp. S3CR25-11]